MVVHVPTRDNAIVNRLNKTKVEKEVDHEAERQERLKLEGRRKKAEATERVGLDTGCCAGEADGSASKRPLRKRHGRKRRSRRVTRACLRMRRLGMPRQIGAMMISCDAATPATGPLTAAGPSDAWRGTSTLYTAWHSRACWPSVPLS